VSFGISPHAGFVGMAAQSYPRLGAEEKYHAVKKD
jgi:hypothetical protein